MTVLFVFNSNKIIGRGHESRCMNIVNSLELMGCNIHLATSSESRISIDNLSKFSSKLYFDFKDELFEFLKKHPKKYKSIVIDNYDFTLDDLIKASSSHSIYKFELTPNLKEDRIKFINFNPSLEGKSDFHCFGPKFFPFKKEFLDIKIKKIENKNSMLIFFGGGDNSYLISRYFEYFKFLHQEGLELNIVVTGFYSNLRKLKKIMAFINFVLEPNDIAKLIKENSFCFISGGTIVYECIFLGKLPQVISIADNQVNQCVSFDKIGNVRYLGQHDEISSNELIIDFKRNSSIYLQNTKNLSFANLNFKKNILAKEIFNGFK